jgi:HD-GYP domain-containing protein (c-di-GMP phosphodiesterase class II)
VAIISNKRWGASMRIKPISALKGNEILAESITTPEKMVMLPKGTVLKEEYIPLIQSLGVENVMIEDPYEEYEEPTHFIRNSQLISITRQVQKVMENHIYHTKKSLDNFENIANEIMTELDMFDVDTVVDMNERTANLYEHTVMVTLLSVGIAKRMKLDRQTQYNIVLGSLLHDIGLRYITTNYTDWDGTDKVEAFEFKKHTLLGYSALDEERWIPDISRKMVLFHHERLDGSGFPMRRKNKEIEIRIIQVCDAFDSAISGIECQRISIQKALANIKSEAGEKFDPEVVNALLSIIAYYPVGTTVKLDNQMEAVVVSQTGDPKNPVIMELPTCSVRKKNIPILQII